MADEKKPDNLEMEKMKLERFKEWRKIITVTITVLFGSVLVAFINYSIQKRQLDQQKLINENELELQKKIAESERRQAEMKYLGDFIELALIDDHTKRLRFAEYFTQLTISGELQKKWEDYRDGILDTIKLLEEKKVEWAKAEDEEEKRTISAEVVQLQAKLDPLPKKSEVFLDREEAGLDKEWRPLKYTDNEFELKSDGNVVYNKAAKLMWQQSGSNIYICP